MNETNAYHAQVNRLQIDYDRGMLSREDLLAKVMQIQSEQDFSMPEPLQPQIVCAWHEKHFNEPLVIREGDSMKRSHGCCGDCQAIELAEVRKMRQARA
jgi:hypothetical protein